VAHLDVRRGALHDLREGNRAQVIDVLRQEGSASRADIARRTGLSRTTVSSLVAELQRAGMVAEVGGDASRPTGGRGRPGVLLALQSSGGTAVGIDLGHTHVRVAVADLSAHVLAERHRRLDVDGSAEAALGAAADLVTEALDAAGADRERIVGAGVGLPAPVDRRAATVGLPAWVGLHPLEELERRLALPVIVDNDANLGALAEYTTGAGKGVRDILYLKLASGIGAGLVLDGRLYRGAGGIAGELGHVHAVPGGLVCRCGNRGCLETVAAGPALVRLLRASHGEDLTTEGLLRLAEAGDVGVRRVFTDAGRSIGEAVAALVNAVNPALIVVGGELSAVGPPLLEGIRGSIERYALPAAVAGLDIVPGVLGERAEILGAIALVLSSSAQLGSVRPVSVGSPR
jgi:predicted NBD/HSP70 family sugar kinase